MRIVLAALFFAFATAAVANENKEAMECARIDDSLRRLLCFDRLFPRLDEDQAAEANPDAGPVEQWVVEEERSPIDDSPKVTAGLAPKEVSSTGIRDGSMFLIMRCSENTTSVIFSTDMFMLNETVAVTTRFGKEPATTTQWGRSTNYQAVGLWSGSQAIPFIRRLVNHETLVVRIQDRDQLNAEFELGNVREVAQKIADACNWDLCS